MHRLNVLKKHKGSSLDPLRLLFFWLPVAVALVLASITPIYLVHRSISGYSSFFDLVFDIKTLSILFRTFILILLVTVSSIAIALPLAWLTERTDLPAKRIFRVLTALPLVIPSYVFALVVVIFLGPKGTLQGLLEPMGVSRIPEIYGLPGAVISLTLITYPYVLLPVRAYLSRMDQSLEEAAKSLGYSGIKLFVTVTLPLLKPALFAGSLLVALYTLSDFGAVSLMRYQTFTWAIYIQYQSTFNNSVAAMLSLVLVCLAVATLILFSVADKKNGYYRSNPGVSKDPLLVKLGSWKPVSVAFVLFTISISLLLPLAVLCYWAIRGLLAGEILSSLWVPALNSITVSLLAAVISIFIAVPLAYLSLRNRTRFISFLNQSTYIGFALPGIVVALAFVYFVSAYAKPLYQTLAVLLLAYVVLFVSTAIGSIQSVLRQVNPNLEDAAFGLGRTPFSVLFSITIPLIWKGVLAGAGLVFLLTMKELPATLVLSPIGFTSLSAVIWSASEEAFFARAAAPALLLVLLSSVPLAIFEIKNPKS